MRKPIIILTLLIVPVAVLYLVYKNHTSYQTVTFEFGENIRNVNVSLSRENKEIISVSSPGDYRVKKGSYQLNTSGSDNYEHTLSEVVIGDKKETILINPSFSETYLNTLLANEAPKIQETIINNIDLMDNAYKVNLGKLYIHGDWYGTTIVPNLSEEELRLSYVDVFRIVLKKSGGEWQLVTPTPELVISKLDFPDIPTPVLYGVNRQYGEFRPID